MSPALERRLLDIANYVKRSVQYIVRVNDDEEFLGRECSLSISQLLQPWRHLAKPPVL